MNTLIGFVVVVGVVVGIPWGLMELLEGKDRKHCATIAHNTQQDLRFIEPHWADWGCFIRQGDDWVDVETGRVIP